MERKTWVKPMTVVQKFEANESVAADTQCWNVSCQRPWINPPGPLLTGWYGSPWGTPINFHDADVCGKLSNQVLRDTDGDGAVDQMLEYGNGTKECTLYTDENYSEVMSPSKVDPDSGNTIYWVNKKDTITFFHKGVPQLADASHPNRS